MDSIKNFIELNLTPSVIIDTDGKVIDYNEKFNSLLNNENFCAGVIISDFVICQEAIDSVEYDDVITTIKLNSNNEKIVKISKKVLRQNGNISYLISVNDVSNYFDKIEKLKESERFHRILLEESTDPIFSFKSDGTYRYINKAFADPFGKKPEEIIGKKIWDIFPKEEGDKRFAVVKEVFISGKQKDIEVRVPQQEKDLYFLTSVKPIFDDNGEVETVICISKNISIRKYLEKEREVYITKLGQTNSELEYLLKNRDKLFAIIAHDLRSPFNSLINLAHILNIDYNDLEETDKLELINAIHTASKNTYSLVENLLSWASLQQNEVNFFFAKYDLQDMVSDSLLVYSEIVKQKNIKINFDQYKSFFVYCDKNSIETVIRNLLSNAIKFSPQNSEVAIKLIEKKDNVIVSFSDNGIGIEESMQKSLMTKEIIKSTQGTQGEKGSGLGLMLCKGFVDKNDGEIWFESEVNKGTTFYFSLKKATEQL